MDDLITAVAAVALDAAVEEAAKRKRWVRIVLTTLAAALLVTVVYS